MYNGYDGHKSTTTPGPVVVNQNMATNQVSTKALEKYTFGSGIKNLLDRLQDMYTSRADMVSITGDGFAAAHDSEIKEIFWVYLKYFGFAIGLIGFIAFAALYVFSFIGGVLLTLGFYKSGLLSIVVGAIPIAYLTGHISYAGYLTYRGIKWATGSSTTTFYGKMEKSFEQCVSFSVWHVMTFGLLIVLLLSIVTGLDSVSNYIMHFVLGFFKLSGLESNSQDIIFNSHIVAITSSIITCCASYFTYKFITVITKDTNSKLREVNIKYMQSFVYRDAVDEAKNQDKKIL